MNPNEEHYQSKCCCDQIESLKKEIQELREEVANNNVEKPMNVEEAAEFLGYEPSSIYTFVSSEDVNIPFTKVGHRLRFSRKRLNEWLFGKDEEMGDNEEDGLKSIRNKREEAKKRKAS